MKLPARTLTCGCALALLLAASPQARAQSISDKLGNWLFGTYSAPADNNTQANTAAEVDCPGVTVRQGASTLSITQPGAEAGPMTTRYQVSIAQTARECAPLGGVMTMKVGVEGRVLLGPVGGPGQIDVPLRMAVVQEGASPKMIVRKVYKLAVALPPRAASAPDFDAYVVYVGFDPQSLNTKPERPAKKPKQKSRHP